MFRPTVADRTQSAQCAPACSYISAKKPSALARQQPACLSMLRSLPIDPLLVRPPATRDCVLNASSLIDLFDCVLLSHPGSMLQSHVAVVGVSIPALTNSSSRTNSETLTHAQGLLNSACRPVHRKSCEQRVTCRWQTHT
jgi:hypothetical protein